MSFYLSVPLSLGLGFLSLYVCRSVCLPVSVCIPVSVCVSVCVYLCVCLCICMCESVCLSASVSLIQALKQIKDNFTKAAISKQHRCLCINALLCLSVFLSVRGHKRHSPFLSVCTSIRLFFCLHYACLSVSLSVCVTTCPRPLLCLFLACIHHLS